MALLKPIQPPPPSQLMTERPLAGCGLAVCPADQQEAVQGGASGSHTYAVRFCLGLPEAALLNAAAAMFERAMFPTQL